MRKWINIMAFDWCFRFHDVENRNHKKNRPDCVATYCRNFVESIREYLTVAQCLPFNHQHCAHTLDTILLMRPHATETAAYGTVYRIRWLCAFLLESCIFVCEFDYPTLMQWYPHWHILHDTQSNVLKHIYSFHLHWLIGILAEWANVNKMWKENFICSLACKCWRQNDVKIFDNATIYTSAEQQTMSILQNLSLLLRPYRSSNQRKTVEKWCKFGD